MPSMIASGSSTRSASPLGHALLLLGDMWTTRILRALYCGDNRFQELRETLSISDPVLSRRLTGLIEAGLLGTQQYQSRPPRREYLLTDSGSDLWTVLVAMWSWDSRHAGPDHPLAGTRVRHLGCDHVIQPIFGCGSCGAVGLTIRDVEGTVDARLISDVTGRKSRRSPSMTVPIDAAGVLGDRWSTLILSDAFMGSRRFGDFLTRLAVPPVTLTQRLGLFVDSGILSRESVVIGGRRQEYRLTPKGADFFVVTTMINAWAQRWLSDDGESGLTLLHRTCGRPLEPEFTCNHCHSQLAKERIRFEQ